jgi:glycosyltransferase involved in cell wall biosynthesis
VVKVLIVIPCFNEGKNIGSLLQQLQTLTFKDFELSVLPVNDCSRDNTLTVIRANTNSYLNLPINLGIGGAVQSGIKYADRNDFDFAVQMDGDGQHPPSELIKLLEAAHQEKSDLCIGSRYLKYEGFQSTALRRLGIRILNSCIYITTGKKIHDSTSGYRVFSRKAIQLFSQYYPDKYPEPESIVYAQLNGLKIYETPVLMIDRVEGETSISGLSSLYYMVKVCLAILFLKLNALITKKV